MGSTTVQAEDSIYHLAHTVLTGDVATPGWVAVRVTVLNASMTLKPVLRLWWERDGMADANTEALFHRVTGITFQPYAEVTSWIPLQPQRNLEATGGVPQVLGLIIVVRSSIAQIRKPPDAFLIQGKPH